MTTVPVRSTPFPSWPHYDQDEVAAVAKVLHSGKVNYWTGEEGRRFEAEFATWHGRRHAVALANGTVALELALRILGIGPGDEVIVPARTFIASASCAVACGARPVLADVAPDSGNLTAETIAPLITPQTRAIVVVHLAGWPCEMEPIMALARHHGIRVVEDCAQAHGARYRGRPAGSFGDAAAFSFCQDKIMSTGGEGGMLLVDDEALWRRAWAYKDHGKDYDAVYHRQHPAGFRWLHESFGTNWRMTEMQAAIGRIQLGKLDNWIARRQRNAAILETGLAGIRGLRQTPVLPHQHHARYRYYAYLEPQHLSADWSQQRIIEAIHAEGVPCFTGSCPEIYLEKAFADAQWAPAAPLPVARVLGQTSLCFLVHPTLGDTEMHDTVAALGKVMAQATGTP